MTKKNKIFAQTLLHKAKQQKKRTKLPNVINVALNFPKLL